MAFDLKVPSLGESVSEAFIGRWHRKDGDAVKADDPILELETDKANVEIRADRAGTLKIVRAEGTVKVGEVLARIEEGAGATAAPAAAPKAGPAEAPAAKAAPAEAPAAKAPPEAKAAPEKKPAPEPAHAETGLSPAVRKRLRELGMDAASFPAAAHGGRPTVADVDSFAAAKEGERPLPVPKEAASTHDGERRTPMSRLRKRIGERLLEAQRGAAILTTFNEIDMSAVIDLRARLKVPFQEKYGVALGFMSFFARSCILALREMPIVNSEIRGDDVVSRDHVHLGIAVSTDRGLVVPVVRHAERLSFAEIEREIGRLAVLARDAKVAPDDLAGGTFTISNGGVFGSLLSTPILNPPQSAILGMHKIEDRPVVDKEKKIVVRPMMYVALSYDHRLIDGRDSVTFLVKVKERLEDPARLMLEV